MANKSALQIARSQYQPKLPSALWGSVVAVEGEPTQSPDFDNGSPKSEIRGE